MLVQAESYFAVRGIFSFNYLQIGQACVLVHFLTFLPFKFFFLKHRKPSTLVILVIVAEFLRKICQFLRKLWRFLKMDSTAQM